MIDAVEGYIKLRRWAGFKMASAECLLQSFACFAAKRRETLIRMQTAIDWAALGPSVSQRDAQLKEDGLHGICEPKIIGTSYRQQTTSGIAKGALYRTSIR